MMRIGIPREIKIQEGRVALLPAAVAELVREGYEIFVEASAGQLSGFPDEQFRAAGAQLVDCAADVYAKSELIVKVKEPVAADLKHLRKDHLLFSFLHLAAEPQLTRSLQEIGLTAIAFETVTDEQQRLPLLMPMSDIAGRLATQIGCNLLHMPQGGKGVLLGGVAMAERGKVVILGAGVAGSGAATLAAALGAEVIVFDRNRERLEQMRRLGNNVSAYFAYQDQIECEVAQADLLIGAVLMVGEKAQHLVSEAMVAKMQPGSVIIDISVDQGGCVETIRATDYDNPTYVLHDVVHFAVTNMPGAVPKTASQALSALLLPYVRVLAAPNWQNHAGLMQGLNVQAGKIIHPSLLKSMR